MPTFRPEVCALLLLCACSAAHPSDGGADASVDASDAESDSGRLDGAVSDAGDDGGADGGVDLSEPFLAFCRRRIRALCDGNAICCLDSTRRYEVEDCSDAAIEMGCSRGSDDPALRDGTLTWDEGAAARIIEELEAGVSGCETIDQDAVGLDRVLRGTLPLDDSCTPEAVNGYGSLGLLRCEAGLRCALSGTVDDFTGACALRGEIGDGCVNPANDCLPGSWCEFGADGVPADAPYFGLCQPQTEPCLGDYACPSRFCVRASQRCVDPEPAQTWCRRFL